VIKLLLENWKKINDIC